MDLTSLGIAIFPSITVVCYVIGELVKVTGVDNKWIPSICGFVGLFSGIAAMHIVPEFPANDYFTASAVGVMSGLAATGANQIIKQITTK